MLEEQRRRGLIQAHILRPAFFCELKVPQPTPRCQIGHGVERMRLVAHQTRSMMVAAPMPEAIQSVAIPTSLSERSSSSSSVPMIIAPVAPKG